MALGAAILQTLFSKHVPYAEWALVTDRWPRTLITMMTSSQKTQRVVKMTCAVVICKGTLGYRTYPAATSPDVPLSPSKELTGQPYKERGDSVGSQSRTKIPNTTISSPHWPAPTALLFIYCTKADVCGQSHACGQSKIKQCFP